MSRAGEKKDIATLSGKSILYFFADCGDCRTDLRFLNRLEALIIRSGDGVTLVGLFLGPEVTLQHLREELDIDIPVTILDPFYAASALEVSRYGHVYLVTDGKIEESLMGSPMSRTCQDRICTFAGIPPRFLEGQP